MTTKSTVVTFLGSMDIAPHGTVDLLGTLSVDHGRTDRVGVHQDHLAEGSGIGMGRQEA